MTVQIIIGVLLLAALVYAWYTERTRRREAELERDVATRRTTLDGINKKLEENKVAYDKARDDMAAHPIPPDMLQYLGMDRASATKPEASPVNDVRSGRLVDPQSGRVVGTPKATLVAEEHGPPVEPGNTGPRFYEVGAGGKAKTTH